MNYVAWRGMKR